MTSPFSLYRGDCTAILPTLPEGSVDLVITDPPYVCRYRDRAGRQVANDDNPTWIAPAFRETFRVMRPGSLCVSFYGWQHVEAFMRAWKDAGLVPVGHLVWPKGYASRTGFLAARHEQAFLLAKGTPPLPAVPISDVQPWTYSGNTLHPTQKAVSILEPLIATFSRRGHTVLDPFAGSGSTGVACARLDRRFIGVELEEAHHATAASRVAAAYRQRAVSQLRPWFGMQTVEPAARSGHHADRRSGDGGLFEVAKLRAGSSM